MHKQARTYWCGPAAIQNALEALGTRVSQKKVAELCGTTKEGTDEHQIMAGLEALGFQPNVTSEDTKDRGEYGLWSKGGCGLLCVDSWGHWITWLGSVSGGYEGYTRHFVVDPLDGQIKLVHWKTLERRWRAAARLQTGPLDKTYYAISIRGK